MTYILGKPGTGSMEISESQSVVWRFAPYPAVILGGDPGTLAFVENSKPLAVLAGFFLGTGDKETYHSKFNEAAGKLRELGLNAPMQAGELRLHPIFQDKTLVSLMCIGIINNDQIDEFYKFNLPTGQVPAEKPANTDKKPLREADLNIPDDYNELLLKLLASPNIAARVVVNNWKENSGVTVLNIKDGLTIGVTLSSNPRYCRLEPKAGAAAAVAAAGRNMVCAGIKPLTVNCIVNLDSVQDAESDGFVAEYFQGFKESCESLGVVFDGMRISHGDAAFPIPLVGMVGAAGTDNSCSGGFKEDGDLIFLLGENSPELGGTEYLKVYYGQESGDPPAVNFKMEKTVQEFVLEEIKDGLIKSARSCNEGGLAVALAHCCMAGGLGADITMVRRFRGDALLFGEAQSRVVITVGTDSGIGLVKKMVEKGIPFTQLGKVTGNTLIINVVNPGCTGCGGNLISLPVTKMEETWRRDFNE